MAIIRKIEVRRFRGINTLDWCPGEGLNCLIGPGDSCKTTVLDAVDLCLGARRNLALSDADFYGLDVKLPVDIRITLGRLSERLKNIESYGLYLRGFEAATGAVQDEPDTGLETVLTIRLAVSADLEPSWTLFSERAETQGQTRGLAWSDRAATSPARLGAYADQNLSWGRASILNKISDETITATAALADLARSARDAFGQQAEAGLPVALTVVRETATRLGVPIGASVKAMLDSQSVSFSGGTIALHDARGVPLKNLGLGSKRLLVAGLQRAAASQAPVVLVDEIEHGLEPHRIIRLLGELGAKEQKPPLQVFMTTHSPVALRELRAEQLWIVRRGSKAHNLTRAADAGDVQGTIRIAPDALLARSVVVCEGASEHGLLRGVDQRWVADGKTSFTALNTACVDGGGQNMFVRARAFQALGYRTAVLHDSDTIPTPALKAALEKDGGVTFAWSPGCALEEELFRSLPADAALKLLEYAIKVRGEKPVDDQIKSATSAKQSLATCRGGMTADVRAMLGKTAKSCGWFKSITDMEAISRDIVAPALGKSAASLKTPLRNLLAWIADGKR